MEKRDALQLEADVPRRPSLLLLVGSLLPACEGRFDDDDVVLGEIGSGQLGHSALDGENFGGVVNLIEGDCLWRGVKTGNDNRRGTRTCSDSSPRARTL